MRLVVDADPLVYGCGFAAEGEPYYHALNLVKLQLNKYKEHFASDDMSVHLTGSRDNQVRPHLYPSYKESRLTAPKPEHYQDIRDYLVEYWGAQVHGLIEADDAVCLEAWRYKDYSLWDYCAEKAELDEVMPTCVMISIDKDLDQVPGWHYKPNKEIFYYIDQDTAGLWWGCQMLTGDPGDDIKGIPGIGTAKAKKFMLELPDNHDITTIVHHTKEVYKDIGLKSEDWDMTYKLVTMLQDEQGYELFLRDFNETTDG